jgi:pyridinium-3,5-biscarboxylic acid mononucleotide synthase
LSFNRGQGPIELGGGSVNRNDLQMILGQVRERSLSVEAAMAEFRNLPYEDLGFARIDHHRALRTGWPEVVFCEGKTTSQAVTIIQRLARETRPVLATRASQDIFDNVQPELPDAEYEPIGRTILLRDPSSPSPRPGVLVLSAGTADIPVAMEAATTAEAAGCSIERVFDVGVAGLHRLLDQRKALGRARVIVVAAGMDGALPSVVGGLVDVPVVAVPTSVGYGASFGGLAALLTMLNSCAPGVAVVNIDNGFGAGYLAAQINRTASVPRRRRPASSTRRRSAS